VPLPVVCSTLTWISVKKIERRYYTVLSSTRQQFSQRKVTHSLSSMTVLWIYIIDQNFYSLYEMTNTLSYKAQPYIRLGTPSSGMYRDFTKCCRFYIRVMIYAILGNAFYRQVQNVSSSCLLSRNVKIRIYKGDTQWRSWLRHYVTMLWLHISCSEQICQIIFPCKFTIAIAWPKV
jgi:hypothetical protein